MGVNWYYIKSYYFENCKIFQLKDLFREHDIKYYFEKDNIQLLTKIKESLNKFPFKNYLILQTGDFRTDYFIYNQTIIILYDSFITLETDLPGSYYTDSSYNIKIIKKELDESNKYLNDLGNRCLVLLSDDYICNEDFYIPDELFHERTFYQDTIEINIERV